MNYASEMFNVRFYPNYVFKCTATTCLYRNTHLGGEGQWFGGFPTSFYCKITNVALKNNNWSMLSKPLAQLYFV